MEKNILSVFSLSVAITGLLTCLNVQAQEAPPPVNYQIIDAVTQTNVKVVGESPADAMAASAQALSHAMGQAMENAASTQCGMQQVQNSGIYIHNFSLPQEIAPDHK